MLGLRPIAPDDAANASAVGWFDGAPATVVLVHGAWHGSWCFDCVVPRLQTAGLDVCAVDLPGTSFGADVAEVRSVLDAIDGEAVLLGHSYGGAVVTEAGAHTAVRQLVYLCAFAISEDESCTNAAADEPDAAAISHEGRPDLGAAMIIAEDGTSTLTRAGARKCLYADVDDATFEWAYARLGAQRIESLSAAPQEVAWRTRPSIYVICSDDRAVHPDLQRIMARRCTESVECPTGHSPFANCPQLVADLLISCAVSAR
jgi:pimeloyl-ACP methyl ester carboxylesterase